MADVIVSGRRGKGAALAGHFAARGVLHIVLILISLLWLLPSVGLLVSSLRPARLIATTGWWTAFTTPFQFTLENYGHVIGQANMGRSFLDVLLIAIPATVMPILIAAFAAYAFAWMRFPGRNALFLVIVGLLVVPLQVTLIPRAAAVQRAAPHRIVSRDLGGPYRVRSSFRRVSPAQFHRRATGRDDGIRGS